MKIRIQTAIELDLSEQNGIYEYYKDLDPEGFKDDMEEFLTEAIQTHAGHVASIPVTVSILRREVTA